MENTLRREEKRRKKEKKILREREKFHYEKFLINVINGNFVVELARVIRNYFTTWKVSSEESGKINLVKIQILQKRKFLLISCRRRIFLCVQGISRFGT